MKLLSVAIHDTCRIRVAELQPNGASIDVRGRNGSGKSSFLNSIAAVLCGKKFQVPKLVRDGAKKSTVRLELGEVDNVAYTLNYSLTAKGSETVTITDADGNPPGMTPRAFLSSLWDSRAIDPLKFMALTVDMLRELVGLDFTELDAERDDVFKQRTEVNRQLKGAESRLAAILEIDAPEQEVSVADLSAELSKAHESRSRFDAVMAEGKRCRHAEDAARRVLADADADLQSCKLASERAVKAIDAMPDPPDTAALQAQIAAAETTNQEVRRQQDRRAIADDVKATKKRSDGLTGRLEAADEAKRLMVSEAKMPIPDLSFGAGEVLFKGRPVANACGAERMTMAVGIALACRKKLDLMLIPDGAVLDSTSLAHVHRMCDEAGVQLVVERPNDGESGDWLLFTDGEASGQHVVSTDESAD